MVEAVPLNRPFAKSMVANSITARGDWAFSLMVRNVWLLTRMVA